MTMRNDYGVYEPMTGSKVNAAHWSHDRCAGEGVGKGGWEQGVGRLSVVVKSTAIAPRVCASPVTGASQKLP